MSKATTGKDVILLLLYARGAEGREREPIEGRTRLMKMIFLFKEEVLKDRSFKRGDAVSSTALPEFRPYDFGPFSEEVFNDIEFLVELGFVKVEYQDQKLLDDEKFEYEYWQLGSGSDRDDDQPLRMERFTLSTLGRSFVEQGEAGQLTDEQWESIGEFKRRCTTAPLREILYYVYTNYPKMRVNSVISDEVLRDYEG